MSQQPTPAGWYHAQGDPVGTTRYWDGVQWVGEPQLSQPSDFGSTPGVGHGGYTPALEPVSGGARIAGRLLDAIVWAVLLLVASIPWLAQFFSSAIEMVEDIEAGGELVEPEISLPLALLTGLIGNLLIVAYETVGNAKWGGTLGKKAINARVVKADGSDLDMASSFRRMWLYLGVGILGLLYEAFFRADSANDPFDLLFFFIALAGLLMLFTDSRRQTPWDKVGGTVVVRTNR